MSGVQNADVIDLDDEQPRPLASAVIAEDGASDAVVVEDAELGADLPARAIRNEDGSITLPFRFPVSVTIKSAQHGTRSERYEKLTFHRLTGADLRAVDAASAASKGVVMLARSARIRESLMGGLFDRMDGADIVDATACVGSFFPNGAKTGRST